MSGVYMYAWDAVNEKWVRVKVTPAGYLVVTG